MKIVVTGSKGYIGSSIMLELQMAGLHPIGIDIREGNDVLKSMPKCDIAIHCAASLKNDGSFKYNTDLTKAVLVKTKNIIFLSSAAVYGESPKEGSHVGSKLHPINEYGRSKVRCEELIIESGKNYSILRLSNVYSIDARHGVIAQFLKHRKLIYGNGKQIRDFVNKSKVLQEILFDVYFLTQVKVNKLESIKNVSSGVGTSINTLFKQLFPGEKPTYLRVEEGYIFRSILI